MSMRLLRTGGLAMAATLTLGLSTALADVQLPNIFSDSMVLQRDQENRVWGMADAGEAVTVMISGQTHETEADADGYWQVTLQPLSVGEPRTLTVRGKNEIKLEDVLVGEVWICSGQSNMQWTVNSSESPDLERLAANFPQIRMINYRQQGSQTPVWSHPDRQWMVCTPENVGNFSAVGYFFARQLHQTLDVPIGMINNAWGGSACEAWINRDVLVADGRFAGMLQRWENMENQFEELSGKDDLDDKAQQTRRNLSNQMGGNQRPANIYNGVLKSHMGYGIKGAIWYQGESNAGRAYQYRELFPLMISSWRKEWGAGDFPFYWVQLADFRQEKSAPGESDWAELREAQTMTMDKLENTGEAVIIDIGEGKDIHPRNKVDVGRRLARWALAKQYAIEIAHQSPRYQAMEKVDGKIVLSFAHVDGGWRPFDVPQPIGFTIAGEDKQFVTADAKILKDGRIEVWSDSVKDPASVRYAWADNPVCNMYDRADLPLTPFRTDDWDGVTKGRE
ncbi:sialate O-acetylesterase [Planctomycetaceae bacterium SH139]